VVTATKLMAQRINAMAARPDMENLLQEFLYKKDTPLDMEEAKVSKTSWLVLKKIKVARFRDIANVTIIGTGEGIRKAKKIIRKKVKPEELKFV
jgi:voltage-gated potassium channel